ncbi:hypothetical protein [Phenylobacterium sp.]|jgi:hypothetical protein|uniref:hypothetical protein n=1 Tax=Phenylobacterium sp. TaxID=1871053 RepID=UPI002F42CCBD
MWLRLAGAVLVTLAAIGAFEYFGVGRIVGGRAPDDAPAANGRLGELFWLAIFFIVMGTSLLAAARRWGEHLKRALATKPHSERRPRS